MIENSGATFSGLASNMVLWWLKRPAPFMTAQEGTGKFSKDVEICRPEGRAASLVTSNIHERNAVEEYVEGDGVGRGFSILIDKVD